MPSLADAMRLGRLRKRKQFHLGRFHRAAHIKCGDAIEMRLEYRAALYAREYGWGENFEGLCAQIVADMTRKFEPLAATRQQQLTLHACGEPLNIPFDRSNIERVLSNLIGNAIKYTPNGGSVRVSVETQNDWAVIRVQDSGSGIPAKDLPYIFDRFFRADAHRPSTKGSGLGLSIVEALLVRHGGRLTLANRPGGGFRAGLWLRAA